jgi:hypothetical protein
MLKSPYLFAVGVLLTLLSWIAFDAQVKANETKLALSFDLVPIKEQAVPSPAKFEGTTQKLDTVQPAAVQPVVESRDRLPVPAAPIPISPTALASKTLMYAPPPLPPIAGSSIEIAPAATEPAKSEAKIELVQESSHTPKDIGLSFATDRIAIENRPVELEAAVLEATNVEAVEPETVEVDTLSTRISDSDTMQLSFAPTDLESALESLEIETIPNDSAIDEVSANVDQVSSEAFGLDDWIFQNGSESLVARTVGSAEGTRHWSGDRTTAYYGHVDPGNGVWNLGTFSYQHGASSPEEADRKQLQRLKRQGSQLKEQAAKLGVELSLEEKLNALDLANQAPLAALDRGGYIERLAQARRLEMTGEEAILWARTYAYLDPDTRAWNAPGLGNNIQSISRDQERRIGAISKALKAFNPKEGRNDALENLQHISLDAAPSFDSQSSDLSNIAASFELPPSTVASAEADAFSAPTVQTLAPIEPPSPVEPPSSTDEPGIAFNSTENLVPIASAEESSVTSSAVIEPTVQEATLAESPSTQTATSTQTASSEDLFDLSEDDLEPQAIALKDSSTHESESAERARQNRLSQLIEGVVSRNQSDAEEKEAVNTENETTERPLWRVEDKILPQK